MEEKVKSMVVDTFYQHVIITTESGKTYHIEIMPIDEKE